MEYWKVRQRLHFDLRNKAFDKRHSPTAMVRLCFALLLLHKEQDRIHVPRRLMDNLEGEVGGEKVHEGGLWEDIFSADLYCEDALLTNI